MKSLSTVAQPLRRLPHSWQAMVAKARRYLPRYWRDMLIISLLALSAGIASFLGSRLVSHLVLSYVTADAWFDGDIPRVYLNMVSRHASNARAHLHPLFTLIVQPPVFALTRLGVDSLTAMRLIIAGVAALWVSVLFALLRLIGARRLDALLFTLLGSVSASAFFWFVVPETFAFGSLSILLALTLVALAQRRQLHPAWYVAVSVLTLSFTVTNWMAGIVAAAVTQHWKRTVQITTFAFCIVIVLWAGQKILFPSTTFFLNFEEIKHENRYVIKPATGGPLYNARSFFFHSLIMPEIIVENAKADRQDWPVMTTRPSAPGSATPWGGIALGIWAALLVMGIWALIRAPIPRPFRIALGVTVLGQLALHTVYGFETFVYSLHFAPLLVVLAALSTKTRARPLALALVGPLIVLLGINNGIQFQQARNFFQAYAPPYGIVDTTMHLPNAPHWPYSTGHIELAAPNSPSDQQGSVGSGGSFSPAAHSFGLGIWVADENNHLVASSDMVPLRNIFDQTISWAGPQGAPQIQLETRFYEAQWFMPQAKTWELGLKPIEIGFTHLMLVVKSAGPNGGPVQSLRWDGQHLLVNDRWEIELDPAPKAVYLGEEEPDGTVNTAPGQSVWASHDHGGFARLELGNGRQWKARITDLRP